MSDLGAIMDALITEARSAVPTLPAGATGVERGIRSGADLRPEELPHLFVHSPTEAVELLDHQQEQRTTTVVLSLVVVADTQEQLATKLDAIRDEIAGNRSLSGVVDYATVTRREIGESALVAMREGVVEVTTVRIV